MQDLAISTDVKLIGVLPNLPGGVTVISDSLSRAWRFSLRRKSAPEPGLALVGDQGGYRPSLLLIFVVWAYWAFIYHNLMLITARVERQVVNALRETAGEAKQQSRSDNSTNSGQKLEFGSRLLLNGILAVFSVMIAAEILLSPSTTPRPGYSAFGFQLGVYALGLGLLSWLLMTIRLWQEWKASSEINRLVSLVRR